MLQFKNEELANYSIPFNNLHVYSINTFVFSTITSIMNLIYRKIFTNNCQQHTPQQIKIIH